MTALTAKYKGKHVYISSINVALRIAIISESPIAKSGLWRVDPFLLEEIKVIVIQDNEMGKE